MIQAILSVEYVDGTTEEVTVSQYEHGLFERWANRHGYTAPAGKSIFEVMPTVAYRYWAWAGKHRDIEPKPAFETWEKTVSKVDLDTESIAADPTQTAP